MRKFLVISIPVVTLVFFVLIMLSGGILKKSFGKNDDIPGAIQLITKDIQSDNWEGANNKTENLSSAWKGIIKRVQFSSERDEINAFDTSLAQLKGAIMAQDKSSSLIALNEAYEHWDGLGK